METKVDRSFRSLAFDVHAAHSGSALLSTKRDHACVIVEKAFDKMDFNYKRVVFMLISV